MRALTNKIIALILITSMISPAMASSFVTKTFTNVRGRTINVNVKLPSTASKENTYWIRPTDDVRNRFKEIVRLIKVKNEAAEIIFRGTFRLSSDDLEYFRLQGVKNLTVDFRNSTFLLEDQKTFFQIVNSSQVCLKRAKLIKYLTPIAFLGFVSRNKVGKELVRIRGPYRKLVAENPELQKIASMYLASKDPNSPSPFDQNARLRFHPQDNTEYFTYEAKRNLFIPKDDSALDHLPANQDFIIKPHEYEANAFTVLSHHDASSNDISILDNTVTNVPGILVYARKIRSGFQISGNRVIKDPTNSRALISMTGGALNIASVNDLIVENNDFAFHGDDSFNIHGNYLTIDKVINAKEFTAIGPYKNFPAMTQDENRVLEIFDKNLKRVKNVKAKYELSSDKSFVTVTLDENLDALKEGYFLNLTQWQPNRIYVANNYFHDQVGRGIVIQARNVMAENNRIENLTGSAISVYTDAGRAFNESGPCFDVTIQDNAIDNVATSYLSTAPISMSPGAINIAAVTDLVDTLGHAIARLHRHVKIFNNTISNIPSAAIFATSAADLTIEKNTISNYFNASQVSAQSLTAASRFPRIDLSGKPAIYSNFTSRVSLIDNDID